MEIRGYFSKELFFKDLNYARHNSDPRAWESQSDGVPVADTGLILLSGHTYHSELKWEIPVTEFRYAISSDKGVPVGARIYRKKDALSLMSADAAKYWQAYGTEDNLFGKNVSFGKNCYCSWVIFNGDFDIVYAKKTESPTVLDRILELEREIITLKSANTTLQKENVSLKVEKSELLDNNCDLTDELDSVREDLGLANEEIINLNTKISRYASVLVTIRKIATDAQ